MDVEGSLFTHSVTNRHQSVPFLAFRGRRFSPRGYFVRLSTSQRGTHAPATPSGTVTTKGPEQPAGSARRPSLPLSSADRARDLSAKPEPRYSPNSPRNQPPRSLWLLPPALISSEPLLRCRCQPQMGISCDLFLPSGSTLFPHQKTPAPSAPLA